MNFLYIMVEGKLKKWGGGGCKKEADFRYREKRNLTIIQDNEQ